MKRNPLWASMLAICLLTALAAGGCAKKQVVSEGEETPPSATQPAPTLKPVQPVRESPIAQPRTEPAPRRTAAVERAPRTPVADKGLSQPTTAGLARVHFDFDKYDLSADARKTLSRNAQHLQATPGVRIRIEGHCDERGTTEYNLALGERRAKSTYQYLMDLGVDPNRMGVVSYGEEQPLDPRNNEEAWALNRRAEFVEIQ